MVDLNVIEAFHIMWDKFAEPVMLIHKTKALLAVNETFAVNVEKIAGINAAELVGKKCTSLATPEVHKFCLANKVADKALETRQTVCLKQVFGEEEVMSFWIPVSGCSDVFVHFDIGHMINLKSLCNDNDLCLKMEECLCQNKR
ncbi:hypothetical protein FACS1894133_1540 [Clostridia bacterium]|nr:hypothetical protein FACS1894133_1540 [Clostridia bacterium]